MTIPTGLADVTGEQLASPAPKTVVRFPNLAGAIVEIRSLPEDRLVGGPRLAFDARCTGCLESYQRGRYTTDIDQPRAWAAKHCATCRALPQPETTGTGRR